MNTKSINGLLGVTAMLMLLVLAFGGTNMLETLGRNIPQQDIAFDYIIGLAWACVIGFSISFWPISAVDKRMLFTGWLAKSIVTLGFMLAYEWNYGLDSYSYFAESTQNNMPWYGWKLDLSNLAIFRLCFYHASLFPNSFHMMKVSFALVGFIGVYLAYKAMMRLLDLDEKKMFYAMMFCPSILFWSSTLGKDPIVLFGIAVYMYGVAYWYTTGRFRYVAMVGAGVLITMVIRIWLGPILLGPLVALVWNRLRGGLSKFLVFALMLAAFMFALQRFQDRFNIDTNDDLISSIDRQAHTDWGGGSSEQYSGSTGNVVGILAFLPLGAFTALFRPLPGDVNNAFGVLAGLENLVFVWLLWTSFRRTRLRELTEPPVLWALLLLLCWACVYGPVSYQNLGAASRFRLQVLPVELALLVYLARNRGKATVPVLPISVASRA